MTMIAMRKKLKNRQAADPEELAHKMMDLYSAPGTQKHIQLLQDLVSEFWGQKS